VIRAFGKSEEFHSHNLTLLNKNNLAQQINMGVWSWYAIRMDLISTLFIATSSFFCVFYRNKTDPVLLGLMIQYSLTLPNLCIYILYQIGEIERQMISAQRLLSLRDIP